MNDDEMKQERELSRIPVRIVKEQTITLSPGGQNVLVELIIREFAERFVPGGKLLYLGDTDEKFAYFDEEGLKELGNISWESEVWIAEAPSHLIHFNGERFLGPH